MTVRELIHELMELPLDATVFKTHIRYNSDGGKGWEVRLTPEVKQETYDDRPYVLL